MSSDRTSFGLYLSIHFMVLYHHLPLSHPAISTAGLLGVEVASLLLYCFVGVRAA